MPERHPKPLTAPVATVIAIFLLFWLTIGLIRDRSDLAPYPIIALFCALPWPILVIADRLDERWRQEAQEHTRQWRQRAAERAHQRGEQ